VGMEAEAEAMVFEEEAKEDVENEDRNRIEQ
jgi:hypothetical protein